MVTPPAQGSIRGPAGGLACLGKSEREWSLENRHRATTDDECTSRRDRRDGYHERQRGVVKRTTCSGDDPSHSEPDRGRNRNRPPAPRAVRERRYNDDQQNEAHSPTVDALLRPSKSRSGALRPHDLHSLSGQALVLLELALVQLEASDTQKLARGSTQTCAVVALVSHANRATCSGLCCRFLCTNSSR